MDRLDSQLIAALRRDARTPVSSLAAALGVSRATIRARMTRLEETGEIAGYTIALRHDLPDAPVRAITMLAVEGKAIDRVVHALGMLPEIRAIHTTNGRWDLVVELATDTLPQFDAALTRIRQIGGVSATETNLLLATRLPGAATARRAG